MVQPGLPFHVEPLPPPFVRRSPVRGAATRAMSSLLGDLLLVRHARARRYVIRVALDGEIRVTVPRRGSQRAAVRFAEEHAAWVEKQRARAALERARPRPDVPVAERRALRARARRELPDRLHELAEACGLRVARVSVRDQRTRWGSCSRAGHICLNWRLVAMPDWVRDYVLIHELMHLKRLDHSAAFWALVAGACPTYKEARGWLRTHHDLMAT